MTYQSNPELRKLFMKLFELESSEDQATIQAHGSPLAEDVLIKLSSELRSLIEQPEISLSDLGSEINRWFGEEEEARDWLVSILRALDQTSAAGGSLKVVDSNGTPLTEGDAVTVIKDLKVKGGSSDLKRGTMIRSIHLTSDSGLIECKVDGSVLVLKTIFLKKALTWHHSSLE